MIGHHEPASSRRNGPGAFLRPLLGALLALALLSPGRILAAEASEAGVLWLPDGAARPAPAAVVVAVHDSTGIGPSGWHYGEQLTAAGIAVLHVELLELSVDGFVPATESDDALLAPARLRTVMESLAQDPRFADAAIGLLAFGDAGLAALRAAADPALGDRLAGLALLYPGCGAVAAAATAERTGPLPPVLLLNGDADEANLPADCSALAAQLGRSTTVRHRQYAGAGYAWDRAPHGPHEVVKLPWPGRPGRVVAASPWPAATEIAATQVAAFFAASFATHRQ